jgi:Glycosyltransferase family 87
VSADARRWDDPRWQLAGFVLAHVVLFAGVFRGVYTMPFSGTGLFYDYGSAIVAGKVPYRDVFIEYPPFALVFFTLPRLIGASFRWYYVWYQVEVVVADLIVLVLLYAARERGTAPWRVLLPYTVLLLGVGPIIPQQYDLFPAAITLGAVVAFAARRDTTAWILLALGAMTKVYPALLAPVFLLLDDRVTLGPRLRRAAGLFAATCVAVLAPLLVIAPASLERMVTFHTERGIQIESVYASIAFAVRSLGIGLIRVVDSHRSSGIAGPIADVLAPASTVVLAMVLISTYAFIARQLRGMAPAAMRDVRIVATSSALVILGGLVASKVLSPQYLIWPLPLLPLVARPARGWIWGVFTVAGVITYYIYPLHYGALLGREPLGVGALAARNLLLLTLTLIVARSLRAACADSGSHAQSQARSLDPMSAA